MDSPADDFVVVTHQDGYLSEINHFVDSIADDLWPVNKKIHDNPELGYKEFIAHETLTNFMKSRPGWEVTPSAYNLATAWVAVFDSGKPGPVVSFNVEMDALEGIGHACGHNLIASASVAGGLATANVMEEHGLGGKVVMFGTPAEEGGGGKIELLRAGAYRDHNVDINLISHPGITADTALMRTSAYHAFKVEYIGREAHAAASPWLGLNALDALITGYNALSVLRQQTMPGDVIQGNITDGGVRPNVIHAYTAGNFVCRANTQKRVRELKKKVDNCFVSGAVATGCTLRLIPTRSYADHVPNRVLGASYRKYFNELSPPNGPIPGNADFDEIEGRTMASTDQGDISYAMPSLSAGFAIPPGPEGNGPHSPDFAKAAATREAFERSLRVGKALAGTAIDVLTQDGLLAEVRKEWQRSIKEN
ncbi:hypothetical protein GGS23DRAFT_544711 [Durotheca rogersii]|uniref:uncharacterized protein n=1 Tax=Durotheca rogersii TaxID=419775 RepID=UPI00221F11A6|nr:uncharacterized protein GGS23DRAFT_544711 [Durotheca rogersii]KAI5868267.1 hypothetical protein GGS23DRAFT_544711 [Durotheca rogersii]